MTIRRMFQQELGKRFNALPREWREHIRRVDSLPKPKIHTPEKPSSGSPHRTSPSR